MKIFGQVLDTDNVPMAFADVTITTGVNANVMTTVADLDGKFVLENEDISPDTVIKISYLNYVPQIFKASDLQGNKIKLVENSEILKEVTLPNGSKPSHTSNKTPLVQSNKQKFVQHLDDHKFVYMAIGGLAGIILVIRAFKK
jgi:hypothetical protein